MTEQLPVTVTLIVEVDGHTLTFEKSGAVTGARYHGADPREHGYSTGDTVESGIRGAVDTLVAGVAKRSESFLRNAYPVCGDTIVADPLRCTDAAAEHPWSVSLKAMAAAERATDGAAGVIEAARLAVFAAAPFIAAAAARSVWDNVQPATRVEGDDVEIKDQPTPDGGWGNVQALVREDLEVRERVGVQRYGSPLRIFNGRDALVDAYQEAMDLTVYLRQAIAERDFVSDPDPSPRGPESAPDVIGPRLRLNVESPITRTYRCVNLACVHHGQPITVQLQRVGHFVDRPDLRCVPCGCEPIGTAE